MLNYTVPSLQFLVGSFDASQYLDSISLSVPMHEPGQPLLWSGQFKVSNNLKAKANGLTDNDFSEFGTPSRWRPYQQQVRLNIKGNLSPVFRIENYRYNAQTGSGEGTLTQIPAAVAGDRPGDLLPTVVGGSIGGAIDLLLIASFDGSTVIPDRPSSNDVGVLDVPLVTRDPWSDACRLSGLGWNWLTVGSTGSIVSIAGTGGSMLFSRSLAAVELVPDLAAIYQSASKIVVTGARQVEDKTVPDPVTIIPAVPRPKTKKTNELRPIGSVFPSLDGDATPMIFEEKVIVYQYFNDLDWIEYVPSGGHIFSFSFEIDSRNSSGISVFSMSQPTFETPVQTITVKRQPLGFLFPSLGNLTQLVTAEVLIESDVRKITLKPRGVIFSTVGGSTTIAVSDKTRLIIEKREGLIDPPVPSWVKVFLPGLDLNGRIQRYEDSLRRELPQKIATRPLITEVLRGEANISPLNWTPVLAKPLVVDFGFLPDAARAEFLATKIGIREQQRRNQVLVEMPIPIEWLASGWPLLGRCQIGNDLYLMDGCAISISDGQAKFGFTGGLVGRGTTVIINSVPVIVQQPQHQVITNLDLPLVFEAIVSLGESSLVADSIVFEATIEVQGKTSDAIGTLVLDATVLTSTGALVSSGIVYEGSVYTVNYQTVPAPASVILDATVSFALLQTITFSVSPSSVTEGTPVIQTINFSVSPSSVLEG